MVCLRIREFRRLSTWIIDDDDDDDDDDIMIKCQKFEFPHIFTALYLLAFFQFLQLSNIVPHAFQVFDLSRHLARGDLIYGDSLAMIICGIKYSI